MNAGETRTIDLGGSSDEAASYSYLQFAFCGCDSDVSTLSLG